MVVIVVVVDGGGALLCSCVFVVIVVLGLLFDPFFVSCFDGGESSVREQVERPLRHVEKKWTLKPGEMMSGRIGKTQTLCHWYNHLPADAQLLVRHHQVTSKQHWKTENKRP